MRKLTLIVILIAIFAFSYALYFLIALFSPRIPISQETPMPSISPIQSVSPSQTSRTPSLSTYCAHNQLSTYISAQGAAGNIYANLQITNTGKTSCQIVLGNTITAAFTANNVNLHQEQTISPNDFLLAPGAKVYSQVHYPNGPQCQSGIVPTPITFLYQTSTTVIPFIPNDQTGKLQLQACRSTSEKTIIDIWPLSKNPITQ